MDTETTNQPINEELKDKWQAQDDFWNSFGLVAYDENSVPKDAVMPYITYEAIGSVFDGSTQRDIRGREIRANIWYRDPNWKTICQKADEIGQKIYDEIAPAIKIKNGYIVIRIPETTPFAQRMDEPTDKSVRRIVLTVNIEFLTNY